jgi:hypothetical protein
MTRAVLSLPPPDPAPTTNSVFFDGFQLCAKTGMTTQIAAASTMLMQINLLLTLFLLSRKGRRKVPARCRQYKSASASARGV